MTRGGTPPAGRGGGPGREAPSPPGAGDPGGGEPLRLFGPLLRGRFLSRENRFRATCEVGGKRLPAFLPNPGRMGELLLPGVPCWVEEEPSETRAVPRTLVAVERMGRPVVLHTHRTNAAARFLLERGLVPGLAGAAVVRAEVRRGRSRFDFLLDRGGSPVWLEVKSGTLFGRSIAMFPDAVTERGRRHVEELAALPPGERGAVLLVIHHPCATAFLPDYHTDPAFARAFLDARGKVELHPVAVRWNDDLTLAPWARPLAVPWEILERELVDGGCYLLLLELPARRRIAVGALGEVDFPEGHYVYAGSARSGLSARIERHRRLRKALHWHVDHLRAACRVAAVLPVRTADDLECDLARAVREVAVGEVPRFGSSDCSCPSHLFRFPGDPRRLPAFQELLQRFRIDRLEGFLPPAPAGGAPRPVLV